MTTQSLNAQESHHLPEGPWKALFVSDVHIGDGEDKRAALLVDVLEEAHKRGVEGFFLLGDIFDFCLGTHSRFQKKFEPVFSVLEKLQAAGKEVVFLEGNHEFAMQFYPTSIPVKGIESHIHYLNKYNTAVAHGDLFAAPERYLWFRRTIKSNWLRRLVWLVPGFVLDLYAWVHSGSSRKMDHYRKINKEEVLSSAAEHLSEKKLPADTLVFGHFHYPFDQTKDIRGKTTRLLSMYSWDKPSCLLLDEGGKFQRVELSYV